MNPAITLRPAEDDDLPRLDEIRVAAFAPVFASFRALLGDELYEAVQARDDGAQKELLASMLEASSNWSVHVAELDGIIVGFVAIRLDHETAVAELGLNAVHPDHAGRGIGTAMYEFALEHMRAAGMRAAIVGTGGDASHAPARRAYEKAGFTAGIPTVWMSRLL